MTTSACSAVFLLLTFGSGVVTTLVFLGSLYATFRCRKRVVGTEKTELIAESYEGPMGSETSEPDNPFPVPDRRKKPGRSFSRMGPQMAFSPLPEIPEGNTEVGG